MRAESTKRGLPSALEILFRLRALRVPGDCRAPAILPDTLVLHVAGDEREQRVVASDSDAGACADLRPALTDEDRAGVDQLSTVDLHAELLRVRVAPVARRAAAFLVCQLTLTPSSRAVVPAFFRAPSPRRRRGIPRRGPLLSRPWLW